ncbi:MAG: 6-pyruvoyl tetrahydrobiopterin synthase [Okeania sp. SIO2C9]|uniref:6-pyruvoyl trahydropterin synthase family protein n=1 Tax=Okeania sp. SIO2C9 TaxID=2607791 RepID=UPI0013C1843B|nr:6-carboxytetrahydropterin synthase [Okeania sp. SIO2C9]NEQ76507.1 6-pyruvoyl tetrahydrobiopterin synthase [Okeania sp. SIO2C9]
MNNQLTKIELFKQAMNFSAGHFTIFSESERENLHGHSFSVYVMFEAEVTNNGMTFDYGIYKEIILNICQFLDEVFLLPLKNPYLKIEEFDEYIYALFNGGKEKIPFLKRDVKLLPVRNITVEELSHWFLQKLLVYVQENQEHLIHTIEVKIFSGPGQSGSSFWSKK